MWSHVSVCNAHAETYENIFTCEKSPSLVKADMCIIICWNSQSRENVYKRRIHVKGNSHVIPRAHVLFTNVEKCEICQLNEIMQISSVIFL